MRVAEGFRAGSSWLARQIASAMRGRGKPATPGSTALAAAALLVLSASGQAVRAQSGFVVAPPPEQYTVSPGGVDMRTGHYAYRETDLSAGQAGSPAAIGLERLEAPGLPGHTAPFANMTHNWSITLTERRRNLISKEIVSSGASDFQVYVSMNGRFETFQALNLTAGFNQLSRTPTAWLSHTGTRGAGGEVYSYTASDGTIVTFRPLGLAGASDCSDTVRCADVSEITQADGTKYSFQYDTRTTGSRARLRSVSSNRGYLILFDYAGSDWNLVTTACLYNAASTAPPSDSHCSSSAASTTHYSYTSYSGQPKLASVQDAAGKTWSFAYAEDATGPMTFMKTSFFRPDETTAWLVNRSAPELNSFAVPEDVVWRQNFADGNGWSYDYDYSPTEFNTPPGQPANTIAGGHYTDGLGRTTTTQFGFPEVPISMTERWTGPSMFQVLSYYLTNPGLTASLSVTDQDGNDYSLEVMSASQQETFRGVLENLQLAAMAQCNECSGPSSYYLQTSHQVTPGPTTVTDPLGRTSTFNYCDTTAGFPEYEPYTCLVVGLLQSWTDPEGITTKYKYSATRKTESRRIAKPGSGLADIVETATYPSDCTNRMLCQKPLTVTDARANTTSYTYDPDHGGLLSEVGPAVNGVSPARKYIYGQRRAWVKNSGGTYVQAPAPVWLLSEARSCNSSTLDLVTGTCAAGASDLVVTSYDYGPDSGPNNLWLRGVVVTTGGTSLRTCYGYDALGNKISETSPRAGLTVCS